jgi:hypothetical protein
MLIENVEGRGHLGDKGVHGRIILKCTLKKEAVRLWTQTD